MDGERSPERTNAYVERMLRFLFAEGGAEGTLGPDGLRLGIPDWEERTKDLRPSDRAWTHGYPLGFAKTQWRLRDRLGLRLRERARRLGQEDKVALVRAHEAVARALDWERLLGSFNYDNACDRDHFPLAKLDLVADNLLLWLDHQGFRVVPKEDADEEPLPEAAWNVPNVFDNGKGMVMLFTPKDDVDSTRGGETDERGNQRDSRKSAAPVAGAGA